MMNIMDRRLIKPPTQCVKSMVYLLMEMGFIVWSKRISRLFRIMGRNTIYRRKNLSNMGMRDYIKSYLNNELMITHANQVWFTDITYIPIKKGLLSGFGLFLDWTILENAEVRLYLSSSRRWWFWTCWGRSKAYRLLPSKSTSHNCANTPIQISRIHEKSCLV